MKKDLSVMMLPTDGNIAYTITKNDDGRLVTLLTNIPGYSFHLYLVSIDKIKIGDWCINHINDKVEKAKGHLTEQYQNNASKIIATTNEELNLPFIPPAFRFDYTKGIIDKLEVELESDNDCNAMLTYTVNDKPELCSINLSESVAPYYYQYDWDEHFRRKYKSK